MQTQIRQHRHFVVAPLLALAILVSSSSGFFSPGATQRADIRSTSIGKIVSLGLHTKALVFPGADFRSYDDIGVLKRGSVLTHSTGLTRVMLGEIQAIGLSGGLHITRYADNISVAGISAPALVRNGNRYTIVPIGRQWRSNGNALPTFDAGYALWSSARRTQALPQRFYSEQLNNLSLLGKQDASSVSRSVSLVEPKQYFRSVMLPEAKKRTVWQNHAATLDALREYVVAGDALGLNALLQDESNLTLFASTSGQDVLAELLAQSTTLSTTRIPLLRAFTQDQDMWLLTNIHPKYSAETWTLIAADVDAEATILALLSIPESDFFYQPKGDLVIDRWQEMVTTFLVTQADPVAVLRQLIERTTKAVHSMDKVGYPARARRFAEAILTVSASYAPLLPEDLRLRLESLQTLDLIELADTQELVTAATEPEPDADTTQPEPEESLSPDESEAQAYRILSEAQALFTTETSLSAVEANAVQVRNLVLSGQTKDRTFDFLLNVSEGKVRNVTEDKTVYPYPMWVEDFVEWAKQ